MKVRFEKSDGIVGRLQCDDVAALRSADHEDFEVQHSCGIYLGPHCAAATVLGNNDLNGRFTHQLGLICDAERSAREDETIMRQGREWVGRFDAANEIVMLWRRLECGEPQTANREEYSSRGRADGERRTSCIWKLAPTLAGLCRPGGPRQHRQWHACPQRGSDRIRRDLLGKRMRRVDQRANRVGAQIVDEARDAAEAAHPVLNIRQAWRLRTSGQRQNRRESQVAGQPLDQTVRFCRAA